LTPTQLRMAIAATQISLRDLADSTGLHAPQISRIQRGNAKGAAIDTMRRLELFFTERGFEFRQYNGSVCVCAPDGPENKAAAPEGGQEDTDE